MNETASQFAKARRFFRSYLGWALMGLMLIGLIQLVILLILYVPNSREQQAAKAIRKLGGVVEFYDPPPWLSFQWLDLTSAILWQTGWSFSQRMIGLMDHVVED